MAGGPPGDRDRPLSAWAQWRLVSAKTCKLFGREAQLTSCVLLAPAIVILGMGMLTLVGDRDSYDASLYTTATMRDGKVATAVWDHVDDNYDIFKDTSWYIGDVLFAAPESALSSTELVALCNYVMNTNSFYNDAYTAAQQAMGPNFQAAHVMPNTCSGDGSSGSPCTCALGSQVFTSTAAMDSQMLSLADLDRSQPVSAALVVTAHDAAAKTVSWAFRYNRTTFPRSKTVNVVNEFAFYPSANYAPFSGSFYFPLQRLTDSYFIYKFGGTTSTTDTLQSYFQNFPLADWKYEATKFFLLGGMLQWYASWLECVLTVLGRLRFIGFALIFLLSHQVKTIVAEKQARIKEGGPAGAGPG